MISRALVGGHAETSPRHCFGRCGPGDGSGACGGRRDLAGQQSKQHP